MENEGISKRGGRRSDASVVKVPISIRLDGEVLVQLKAQADRRGIPYQTFIGSVLHQFVNGELIERSTLELLRKLPINEEF